MYQVRLKLCELVHEWPAGGKDSGVSGLYPDKYILLGERMLVEAGRLYEKTYRWGVG